MTGAKIEWILQFVMAPVIKQPSARQNMGNALLCLLIFPNKTLMLFILFTVHWSYMSYDNDLLKVLF